MIWLLSLPEMHLGTSVKSEELTLAVISSKWKEGKEVAHRVEMMRSLMKSKQSNWSGRLGESTNKPMTLRSHKLEENWRCCAKKGV